MNYYKNNFNFASVDWWEDKNDKFLVHFLCLDNPPHCKIKNGERIISGYLDKLRTCKDDPSEIEKYIFYYKIKNKIPYIYGYRYIFKKDI